MQAPPARVPVPARAMQAPPARPPVPARTMQAPPARVRVPVSLDLRPLPWFEIPPIGGKGTTQAPQIGKPRRGGAFRQRACKPDPVASGHLSRRGRSPGGAPKRTCDLPGPRRAGSTVLLGLAPGGVCLAAVSPRRRCALTAPFHLYLYAAHVWPRHRPCISVALSRGFRRVGVTHRPALWCPDFPRGGFLSAPRPLGSL